MVNQSKLWLKLILLIPKAPSQSFSVPCQKFKRVGNISTPEVWQRGPIEGIPGLLQPVAHAILQAEEEITAAIAELPVEQLWAQPLGMASVAFHVQHITGMLDRLFTYADGKMLNEQQFEELKMEGIKHQTTSAEELLAALHERVKQIMQRLGRVKEKTLQDARGIGRQQIPTTVGGLLFHAAEHTMRHTGQLVVTVKLVKSGIGVS